MLSGTSSPSVKRERVSSLAGTVARDSSHCARVDRGAASLSSLLAQSLSWSLHPPMGALGLEPQKICVPTIPTTCTRTVFSTIDFAVAVPTPTGPPDALYP